MTLILLLNPKHWSSEDPLAVLIREVSGKRRRSVKIADYLLGGAVKTGTAKQKARSLAALIKRAMRGEPESIVAPVVAAAKAVVLAPEAKMRKAEAELRRAVSLAIEALAERRAKEIREDEELLLFLLALED